MSVVMGAPRRLRLPIMGAVRRYIVAPCVRFVFAVAEMRWVDIAASAALVVSIALLSAVAALAIAVGERELLAWEAITLGGFSFALWLANRLTRGVKEKNWAIRFGGRAVAAIIAVIGITASAVSLPYFIIEFLASLTRMGN